MSTLLNGPQPPEDAPLFYRGLFLLLTPIRLVRQRTAVNLTASYVAMAVLTAALLLGVLYAMIFWAPLGRVFGLQNLTMDATLGEAARTYSHWLDPDDVASLLETSDEEVASTELAIRLDQIVAGEVPGFDPATTGDVPRVDHAAIVSLAGDILATDDQTWMATGSRVTDFERATTREVTARSLMLNGLPDPAWGDLYSMAVVDERTSAAFPLITDEGEVVAILVLEGNPIWDVLGFDSRGALLREQAIEFVRLISIVAIPAIVVAIPFGWWRSRSISRRLERLAAAADAMAEGDLDTRVTVSKPDEIGRLGERFNEMASTIETNERIRRAFISNVSHELRTPLTIIQGTVERQLDHPARSDAELNESLRLVLRESDMLERMVSDLFTVTRGHERSLRLDRKAFNFADVARETVAGVQDLAWSQSRVSIESLVGEDLPLVMADPIRIRQVLNNLIYNALRHTPEGGLVVVQATRSDRFLEASVSDTGAGIPNEEIDLVFERYYRAERGIRHDDGSGLGLSVVQQLVRAHGGDVAVESARGTGTTFRFTLPLAS
jgi:signal transduction histidine kinase